MRVKIEAVENGYIVTCFDGERTVRNVYPETLEGLQHSFYQILEDLGHYGSKHDPERIRIVIEKQNNYDDDSSSTTKTSYYGKITTDSVVVLTKDDEHTTHLGAS